MSAGSSSCDKATPSGSPVSTESSVGFAVASSSGNAGEPVSVEVAIDGSDYPIGFLDVSPQDAPAFTLATARER